MGTFLLAVGLGPHANERLEQIRARLPNALPRAWDPGHERWVALPELEGGLCLRTGPSFSLAHDPSFAVAAWGKLHEAPTALVADALHRLLRDGASMDDLRAQDGEFGAVVVDRRARRVEVVLDYGGRRTLRWAEREGAMWISSHQLPLVVAGAVAPRLDPISLACSLALDFSAEGRGLIRGVRSVHPAERLSWEPGHGCWRTWGSALIPTVRVPPDAPESRALIEAMIQHLLDLATRFSADAPEIEVDLTAGLDSRAVLASAVGALGAGRIIARTVGGPRSREVRAARRVVQMTAGLRHVVEEETLGSRDDVEANLDELAFAMCGDSNGKRALMPRPPPLLPRPRMNGTGGGVFKSWYHQGLSVRGWDAERAAAHFLHGHARRLRTLHFQTPELIAAIATRVRDAMAVGARFSKHGADILDLFHYWERFGRFGAARARLPWTEPMLSPFDSSALVHLGFSWEPPIARGRALHVELVRRFLPGARRVPVNLSQWVSLQGDDASTRLWRWLRAPLLAPNLLWELPNALGARTTMSHERARVSRFGRLLEEGGADALLSAGSASRQVLDGKRLEHMVDDHRSGRRAHLEVLGILVVAERAWARAQQLAHSP